MLNAARPMTLKSGFPYFQVTRLCKRGETLLAQGEKHVSALLTVATIAQCACRLPGSPAVHTPVHIALL